MDSGVNPRQSRKLFKIELEDADTPIHSIIRGEEVREIVVNTDLNTTRG